MPVQRVAHRRTASRTVSRTHFSLVARTECAGRGIGCVRDEIVAVILNRNTERTHERASGEPPHRPTGRATVMRPPKPIRRRSVTVAPSAGRMTSPSRTSCPTRTSSSFFGAPGASRITSPFFCTIVSGTPLASASRACSARCRILHGPGRRSAVVPICTSAPAQAGRGALRHAHAPDARSRFSRRVPTAGS